MAEKIDVTSLPYAQRRLLVVMSDEDAAKANTPPGWLNVAEAVVSDTLFKFSFFAPVIESVIDDFRGVKARARDKGLDMLVVGRSDAAELSFPLGHPREGVVYVGHPAAPTNYVPMAGFHRLLFEHKVVEALRLIGSLGATEVQVEHISGWTSTSGITGGVSLPVGAEVQIHTTAGRTSERGSHVMFTMALSPGRAPHIPDGLLWYPHEQLWQEVARARLASGLRAFSLDVAYTDDYGVNAALNLAVTGIGLEVGGSFTEHQSTIWRMRGVFADA